MKTKFLKILISTTLAVPFSAISVLADTNNPAENSAVEDAADDQKPVMLYEVSDEESEDNQKLVNPALSGSDGVHWFLSVDNTLYIDAGKLARSDTWRKYSSRIQRIRVVPKGDSRKLILPENCEFLFSELEALTDIDLSNFDTSHVKNMYGMFLNCCSLENLDLSSLDTGRVENMGALFAGCSNLKNLNVCCIDTSHVKKMNSMFSSCSSLANLDLSHFNVDAVQNFSCMFSGCCSLQGINLTSFFTFSAVDMSYMFSDCRSLTNVDVSYFDTSHVNSFQGMFMWCRKLHSLDLSNFDTQNVYDMQYMFTDCGSLESLDLSNFDTAKIKYDQSWYMYSGCSNLESINISKNYFKGYMAKNAPHTEQAVWYQRDKQRNVKSWSEMAESWTDENAGWWSLVHDSSRIDFETNGGTEFEPLTDLTGRN
ncbi:MAG: BspA family leucine-rich repeat surface protein [Erysipelotrichaceae bacterium]|nr:BspA family leucine-rich repeat surface protein [Erysipelotrichaceae bacterium]